MKQRYLVVLAVISLLVAGCVPLPAPPAEASEVAADLVLTSFASESFGITGVAPEGWAEIAPGIYNRGQSATDVVRLIQQAAAGATADQLGAALTGQLGIATLPESTGTMETAVFTWDIFQVDVEAPGMGTVKVDLALAESGGGAYIVLLQALADEYEVLHDTVFLPAVDALAVPVDEEEGETYHHPDGLFSVPVPTNWTVTEHEGYAAIASPDDEVYAYTLAIESDDLEQAIADGWAIIDPEFDLEQDELIDEPVTNGAERAVTIVYDTGEEERLVIGGGWLHEGIAYLVMFEADLESFQKRQYQLVIISTGFDIAALDKTDLSNIEPRALDGDLLAELETYIEEKMTQLETPGAAVAIVKDGELVYANGFGVRDLETGEPITPQTMMMIGSSTKSMTTLLMAQLVDAGVFDWDTPVVDVLPEFRVVDPEISKTITMRNMVCACSGVPRRDFEWLFNADNLTAEEVLESLADFEFFSDFGEAFQYSNQMVAAGGYLATLAAGGEYGSLYDDYLSLLQDNVIDPIGMTDSTFSFDEVLAGENYATPYGRLLTGEVVELPMHVEEVLIPIGPAGALWSNVLDMAKYVQTDLSGGIAPDGTRIVSAENLGKTWEPQVAVTADISYGLGWMVEDYDGIQVFHHGGNTFGFSSELAFVPELNLGISILTNQRASGLNSIVRIRLLEMLYGQESEVEPLLAFQLEQVAEGRAELRERLTDTIASEEVESYLGAYTSEVLGDVTLLWVDDKLMLDVGEFQSEIRSREKDDGEIVYFTFTPPVEGVPFEFVEDDDGNPTLVFGVGVVEYTFVQAK